MRLIAGVGVVLVLVACTATPPPRPTRPPSASASATVAPSQTPPASQSPTDPQVRACEAVAATLSLADLAGQVLMVGVAGTLDRAERRALEGSRAGAVILMGGSGSLAATSRLTDSLQDLAGRRGILVGVDQEGGLVQRLDGPGFDTIPSAARQAKLSDAVLEKRAAAWGAQLAKAGVHLNLAPVADVVPAGNARVNQPIARLGRGYGADPDVVSAKVAAFSAGMRASGVGSAVKHFPGLGAVKGNTDHAADVVDTTTKVSGGDGRLAPFRAAVEAEVEAVMISSARYRRIDDDQIATFSPAVIGILRDWGYDGVVISDDLGVAAALKRVPVKQRAVRFLAAGGDLALTVDPATARAMAAGLRQRATADPEFADRLREAATRILTLKEHYGLTTCLAS